MQLTLYTDYSLRVLVYLSLNPDQPATISDVSDYYDISRNHLVKVVHNLAQTGFIKSTRGKGGGIQLARPADQISVADVIRHTEPNFHMVECFDRESPRSCAVLPVCELKGILNNALLAFLKVLDQYHISDLVRKGPALESVLQFSPKSELGKKLS